MTALTNAPILKATMTDTSADQKTTNTDTMEESEHVTATHTRTTRWMHWFNFPLITIMIWSGMRIYWADRKDFLSFVPQQVDDFLLATTALLSKTIRFVKLDAIPDWLRKSSFGEDRTGEERTLADFDSFGEMLFEVLRLDKKLAAGMSYHFTFGWFFAINGLLFALYLYRSGRWRELFPKKSAFKNALIVVLHDLKIWRKPLPEQGKYNAAQQISYSIIIVLGGVALLTGLAIYKPTQLSLLTSIFGGYETSKDIHFWTTIAFLLFFFIHILQVAKAGWSTFMAMVTGYDRKKILAAQPPKTRATSANYLQTQTRRSVLLGATTLFAGFGAWTAIRSIPEGKTISQPLRNGHKLNEFLWRRLFRSDKLAPTFKRSTSSKPRVNGTRGMRGDSFDVDAWQMNIIGPNGNKLGIETLERIQTLPKTEMTVEHKCVEGWSHIVTWGGVRFSDWADFYKEQIGELPKYVNLRTPDERYYVSLDIESMMHTQTMLTYELENQPLEEAHGAPLRLTTPLKYGIKQIKRIGTIEFSNTRGPDFWEERGYDWYSHL